MDTQEIKLKISQEDDLYCPLDPDRKMLSEDVTAYLEKLFLSRRRRLRERYSIRILSDAPVDEQHVKEALCAEYESRKDDLRHELRKLTLKGIYMAILGIISLSLWLYLSAVTESLGVEILSIMAWVFLWEVISIVFIERPHLVRELWNLNVLLDSEIRVQIAQ